MVTQTIPQKGDKKKLLDLSKLNVKQYKFDRLKQAEKLNPEQKQTRLMKEIQTDLGLPKLPLHIELFDNSNISGTDAVAAWRFTLLYSFISSFFVEGPMPGIVSSSEAIWRFERLSR